LENSGYHKYIDLKFIEADMFLPPTVHSGISAWLQVMSDPESYKKRLAELKLASDSALKIFKDSQESLATVQKMKDSFDKDSAQFKAERAEFIDYRDTELKRLDTLSTELNELRSNLNARKATLEHQEKTASASLSVREESVSKREEAASSALEMLKKEREEVRQLKSDLDSRLSKLKAIAG
jgi:chromosome segregation ATPase